ncbi:hypothetical protein ACVR1G_06340 [Streptococcus dentasini]
MKILFFLGQKTILLWSFFIFTILTITSLIIRTNMPMDGSELSHMRYNEPLFFAYLSFLLLFFVFFVHIADYIKDSYLFVAGSVIYIVLGIYLMLHQNDMLRHDSVAVLEAAKALNRGDYSLLTSVFGYLHKYPHQLGLVSFERFILAIFGEKNVKIFFTINLIMAIGDNFFLWRITQRAFKNPTVSKLIILLSFLFLPQLFFILFVYGLTYGLFFALAGLFYFQIYLENRNWIPLILTIVFFTLSNIVRNNYIILALSILIVLALDWLVHKPKKNFILALGLLVSVVSVNRLILTYYQQAAAVSKLEGEPKIAWVAMGLNDNAAIYNRVAGWYDAYVEHVYNKYNGNSDKIEVASRKQIAHRLDYMKTNPRYAVTFFKNKFVSMWTDSLFESIWSGPATKLSIENQKISGNLMSDIYEGGWAYEISYYFSALLLVIIYGSVLPVIVLQWRQRQTSNLFLLIPLLYLSGGLIFHLLWEAKSQYIYPYVYLLLPLTAYGLYALSIKVKNQRCVGRHRH